MNPIPHMSWKVIYNLYTFIGCCQLHVVQLFILAILSQLFGKMAQNGSKWPWWSWCSNMVTMINERASTLTTMSCILCKVMYNIYYFIESCHIQVVQLFILAILSQLLGKMTRNGHDDHDAITWLWQSIKELPI